MTPWPFSSLHLSVISFWRGIVWNFDKTKTINFVSVVQWWPITGQLWYAWWMLEQLRRSEFKWEIQCWRVKRDKYCYGISLIFDDNILVKGLMPKCNGVEREEWDVSYGSFHSAAFRHQPIKKYTLDLSWTINKLR